MRPGSSSDRQKADEDTNGHSRTMQGPGHHAQSKWRQGMGGGVQTR